MVTILAMYFAVFPLPMHQGVIWVLAYANFSAVRKIISAEMRSAAKAFIPWLFFVCNLLFLLRFGLVFNGGDALVWTNCYNCICITMLLAIPIHDSAYAIGNRSRKCPRSGLD